MSPPDKYAGLAPIHHYDGRKWLNDQCQSLCLPWQEASARNWELFKAQGTIDVVDATGQPLSCDAIRKTLYDSGLKISEILGALSPDVPYFFLSVEFLIVSADGDAIFTQRAPGGALPGILTNIAGGFSDVIAGYCGPQAESVSTTGWRETIEELKIKFNRERIVDLKCPSFDHEVTVFVLSDGQGLGIAPNIVQRAGFVSRRSTEKIVSSLVAKFDSIGLGIVRRADWLDLALGANFIPVDYIKNSCPFAAAFFPADSDALLDLDRIKDAACDGRPLAPDRKLQRGKFDLNQIILAIGGRKVFRPTTIAAMTALMNEQSPVPPAAMQVVGAYREKAKSEMLKPGNDLIRRVPATIPEPGH